MAMLDPKALADAGFTAEIKQRRASAVINIAGTEGTGKTHWALGAPKPLLYQATDFGDEGVIQKFSQSGQIIRPKGGDYKIVIPHEYRAFVDRDEKDNERKTREGKLANYIHESFYLPFRRDLEAAIKMGVRSVVWDTQLEIWEFIRLSVYGRGATNRDDLKTEANAKMKEMIRLCNVSNVNLIMISRLKPAWESYYKNDGTVGWRQTKDMEMQGFDKSPELVALNLWTKFTAPETWEFLVKKSRDVPTFTGATVPALPFVDLMGMLIPGVPADAWEN